MSSNSDFLEDLTWAIKDLPLDYFNYQHSDYICCTEGVYELNHLDTMDTDDEDVFAVSDVDESPKLVYKYKKPAIAFSPVILNDDANLFSLHNKRPKTSTQSQISGVSSFYIECTSLRDKVWNCRKPNVILLEVKMDPTIQTTGSPSGIDWIHVTPGFEVKQEFCETKLGESISGNRVHLVIFVHLSADPDQLHIIFLNENLDVIGSHFSCNLTDLSCSNKVGLILNQSIFENVLPLNLETLENCKDKISFVLSKQKASTENFKDSFLSLSGIRDIKPFENGLYLLFSDDTLWQYLKKGRSIEKVKIPVSEVSFFFASKNKELGVISRSGTLYRLSIPYSLSDNLIGEPCDSNFEDYLKAADSLKLLSLEQAKSEEELRQIQYFVMMQDQKDLVPFEVDHRVVVERISDDFTSHKLVLVCKQGQTKAKADKILSLRGKFWHLVVSISSEAEGGLQIYQEAVPLPEVIDETFDTWTTIIDLPRSSLTLNFIPLSVELRLCLSVEEQSLIGQLFSKFDLSAVDFMLIGSFEKKSRYVFTDKSVLNNPSVCSSESFELFLDRINLARPAFNLVSQLENESSHDATHFEIEISRAVIKAHKHYPLFFKFDEDLICEHLKFRGEWSVNTCIFGIELIFDLLESTKDNIRLKVRSDNPEALLKTREDLTRLKLVHLVQSDQSHVDVPLDLVSKLEDLKSFLDNFEASEENADVLKTCYQYMRNQVSAKLP